MFLFLCKKTFLRRILELATAKIRQESEENFRVEPLDKCRMEAMEKVHADSITRCILERIPGKFSEGILESLNPLVFRK